MSSVAVPSSLHRLAERLPFGLDDSERVGAAFQRWCAAADGEGVREKRIVDLWTYCFVRRYFLVKFAVRSASPSSDLDALVERVYQKVETGRDGVRQPERYAHWVSVVCKNTFLNYLRRERPPTVSLDDDHAPPLSSEEEVRGDLGLARGVVDAAIERLPDYLQEVARLRLLEGRSYRDVSEATGIAVPTARSYAGRARDRLREDPAVRALWDGERGENP